VLFEGIVSLDFVFEREGERKRKARAGQEEKVDWEVCTFFLFFIFLIIFSCYCFFFLVFIFFVAFIRGRFRVFISVNKIRISEGSLKRSLNFWFRVANLAQERMRCEVTMRTSMTSKAD
jgi:hypothetical protein